MKIMILTKTEKTGIRFTGREIKRDGNYFPETEACNQAKAVVWSSDESLFPNGVKYAKENGYTARIMDDCDDVLSIARKMEENA